MSTRKKRKVIAGNWKMNMTPSEAKELIAGIYGQIKGKKGCDVVVCVPYIDIPVAAAATKGTIIKLAHRTYTLKQRAHTPAKFPLPC